MRWLIVLRGPCFTMPLSLPNGCYSNRKKEVDFRSRRGWQISFGEYWPSVLFNLSSIWGCCVQYCILIARFKMGFMERPQQLLSHGFHKTNELSYVSGKWYVHQFWKAAEPVWVRLMLFDLSGMWRAFMRAENNNWSHELKCLSWCNDDGSDMLLSTLKSINVSTAVTWKQAAACRFKTIIDAVNL